MHLLRHHNIVCHISIHRPSRCHHSGRGIVGGESTFTDFKFGHNIFWENRDKWGLSFCLCSYCYRNPKGCSQRRKPSNPEGKRQLRNKSGVAAASSNSGRRDDQEKK